MQNSKRIKYLKDVPAKAVALYLLRTTRMSYRQISTETGIPKSTVFDLAGRPLTPRLLLNQQGETLSYQHQSVVNGEDLLFLNNLLSQRDCHLYLDEIQRALEEERNLHLSLPTISRILSVRASIYFCDAIVLFLLIYDY